MYKQNIDKVLLSFIYLINRKNYLLIVILNKIDKPAFGVKRAPQRIFGQLKFHIYVR